MGVRCFPSSFLSICQSYSQQHELLHTRSHSLIITQVNTPRQHGKVPDDNINNKSPYKFLLSFLSLQLDTVEARHTHSYYPSRSHELFSLTSLVLSRLFPAVRSIPCSVGRTAGTLLLANGEGVRKKKKHDNSNQTQREMLETKEAPRRRRREKKKTGGLKRPRKKGKKLEEYESVEKMTNTDGIGE